MRGRSLGVDLWTWVNFVLALSCMVLLVSWRETGPMAVWVGSCIAAGTIFTVLGRASPRPAVPLTIATGALLTPWVALAAVVFALSLAPALD